MRDERRRFRWLFVVRKLLLFRVSVYFGFGYRRQRPRCRGGAAGWDGLGAAAPRDRDSVRDRARPPAPATAHLRLRPLAAGCTAYRVPYRRGMRPGEGGMSPSTSRSELLRWRTGLL
jgi:hypothetical protein